MPSYYFLTVGLGLAGILTGMITACPVIRSPPVTAVLSFPTFATSFNICLVGSFGAKFFITASIHALDNCVFPSAAFGSNFTTPFVICLLSESIVTLPSFATQT